jgi:TorA maturation chaperone TorD
MHSFTIKELTSALNLCADVFSYPKVNCINSINQLGKFTNNNILEEFFIEKEDLESIYIQLFSVGSKSLQTVPFASYWINGKMMGRSYESIESFYQECGYKLDKEEIKLPIDHISVLLSFVCLLLEDGYVKEANVFVKNYLSWVIKFKESLKNATDSKIYYELATATHYCLTALENKI